MVNGPGVAASGSGTVQEAQAIDSPEEQRRRRLARARAERELQQRGMTGSTARVVSRTRPDRSQPQTEATVDAAPGLGIGGPRRSSPFQEEVSRAEREAERAEASIGVPDEVPVVGGATFFEFGGQARAVEPRVTEETVEGPEGQEQTVRRAEFEEQDRFGDSGVRFPGAVPVVGGQETDEVFRNIQESAVDFTRSVRVESSPSGFPTFVPRADDEPPEGTAVAEGGVGFVAGLPVFGQEATEFVFEAATETAAGRGGEFAGEVGDAALGRAAEVVRQFEQEPTRTGGVLAGSALVTAGGIGGATRVLGPRAGRATSFAIQPGEELAIAAARRGAFPVRGAELVGDVSRSEITRGRSDVDTEADVSGVDAQASGETATRSVDDPLLGPVEGRLLGAEISAQMLAARARQRLSDLPGDVRRSVTQRARSMGQAARGTFQGAQLSAEAQLTRGAVGLRELVREAQAPPRPEGPRFELDPDELASSGVEVDIDPGPDAGAGVGAAGGGGGNVAQFAGGGARQVAVQRPRGAGRGFDPVRLEPERRPTTSTLESVLRFEVEPLQETALENVEATELNLEGIDPVSVPVAGERELSGFESRQGAGQEPRLDPIQEPRIEPREEVRQEGRQEPRRELRQEPRTEPRVELRSEPRTEPRTEIDLPGDFPDLEPDRERRRRFGLFTRGFRNPVGEPAEALDVVIGDDLGDIDADLEVDV